MVRLKRSWIGLVLGFVIGVIIMLSSENNENNILITFTGGAAFSLFGLIFYSIIQLTISSIINRDLGFLKGEKKFLPLILMLAAEIVKADGKTTNIELELVKKRLSKEFNPEDANVHFATFKSYLDTSHSLSKLGKVIDYEFDARAKAQLIYMLISIAAADGLLSEAELNVIQKISRYGNIRPAVLIQTFKMFEFKREQSSRQKSQRSTGNRKSTLSESTLRKAYELIGVSADAAMDIIKKAYRKLAKIHHPDKVAHLGEIYQTKAKEKFQLILDAYDLIKEKRGV